MNWVAKQSTTGSEGVNAKSNKEISDRAKSGLRYFYT